LLPRLARESELLRIATPTGVRNQQSATISLPWHSWLSNLHMACQLDSPAKLVIVVEESSGVGTREGGEIRGGGRLKSDGVDMRTVRRPQDTSSGLSRRSPLTWQSHPVENASLGYLVVDWKAPCICGCSRGCQAYSQHVVRRREPWQGLFFFWY